MSANALGQLDVLMFAPIKVLLALSILLFIIHTHLPLICGIKIALWRID